MSQIVKYLAMQSGGCNNVGFMAKDLYNKINEEKKKVIDLGYAERTLGYMSCLQDKDKMFYFKYLQDDKGRLSSLLGRLKIKNRLQSFWRCSSFR